MRHIVMAAAMLLGALAITFCAASVLQDVATARVSTSGEPFKVDIADPAVKPFALQERVDRARGQSRDEARLASW